MSPDDLARALVQPGRASIPYLDRYNPERPLVLECFDGTAENLPMHAAAMAQGPNRFTRAQFYLDRGRAEAAKLGVPCRWSRVVVPGVAHEGMRMSAFAGDYWFGTRG